MNDQIIPIVRGGCFISRWEEVIVPFFRRRSETSKHRSTNRGFRTVLDPRKPRKEGSSDERP